jgi:hypothetical protein
MKALIDRHFCLVTGYGTADLKSLVEGKRTALLVTCAGPVEKNADLIQVLFDRLTDFGKCKAIGKYVVPFCTTPEALNEKVRGMAHTMAGEIAGI